MSLADRALTALATQGAMSREGSFDLLSSLPYDERRCYEIPVEDDDHGWVGSSAFGMLPFESMSRAEERTEALLSKPARDALAKSDGDARRLLVVMLQRVGTPLCRCVAHHAEPIKNSGLHVWKMYASSGPGMIYWTHGSKVQALELFASHDR